MIMKSLLKTAAFQIVVLTFSFVLFVVFFKLPIFKNINILFYRGIVILVVSSFCTLATLLLIKKKWPKKLYGYKDMFYAVVCAFCLILVFFTHMPVTADRSMTIFLLGSMNRSPDKSFTKADLTKVFIEDYVINRDNIEKRIDEQMYSGNIQKSGLGYRITSGGRALIKFYIFIANIFGIDKTNMSN